MKRPVLPLLVLQLLGGSGCVYYNAMYNTDRLADDARRAEREGRPFEAQGLWGRAGIKADSIVARHPNSKWFDDALVIRAEAYAGSGQCVAQEPRLQEAIDRAATPDLKERATLAAGQCFLQLNDPNRALPFFSSVVESRNKDRRESAALMQGIALRRSGQPVEAADVLGTISGRRARNEFMMALASAGQTDSALSIARDFLRERDPEVRWDSLLTALGERAPARASEWLDTLRLLGLVQADRLGPLLAEDAARLRGSSPELATNRLRELATLEVVTDVSERAKLQLLADTIASARSLDDLRAPSDSLRAWVDAKGMTSIAADLNRMVRRALTLADSATVEHPTGDMRRFIVAEFVRDSLGASSLAASLFASVAEEWPASPYAGKALLAARDLGDEWTARTDGWLERFATNPYMALLSGGDPAPVLALEDSLASYARTLAEAAPRPGQQQPGVPARGTGTRERPRPGTRTGAPIE